MENIRLQSLQILYTFVLRLPQNGRTSGVQNLQNSQAYIFRILQHFATKLGNFTNFNMLFLAVVKDFDFFAKMKIQFKRGMAIQSASCGVKSRFSSLLVILKTLLHVLGVARKHSIDSSFNLFNLIYRCSSTDHDERTNER